ncbi:hypothetical protein OMAG_001876 [Candidatus Omnitrophus magneticus]|uniref:Uncharacterized protein n=1 Tax=Candidatus Omnitrophus magneticus TaxID=1609969 RepID=A0A0F0CQH7_9BACT|nr:hypothetical protein OMAG_001876 [Candidatus Omnitrophus magneticus]
MLGIQSQKRSPHTLPFHLRPVQHSRRFLAQNPRFAVLLLLSRSLCLLCLLSKTKNISVTIPDIELLHPVPSRGNILDNINPILFERIVELADIIYITIKSCGCADRNAFKRLDIFPIYILAHKHHEHIIPVDHCIDIFFFISKFGFNCFFVFWNEHGYFKTKFLSIKFYRFNHI